MIGVYRQWSDMRRKMIVPVIVLLVLALSIHAGWAQDARLRSKVGVQTSPGGEEIEGERAGEGYRERSRPLLEGPVDPEEYILGPYDRLIINLMGPEPRSFSLTVLPEGEVFLPGIGAVQADGLSLAAFRDALTKKVYAYFKNIEIFCYLEVPRSFRVFVTGQVERPGAVEASAVQRVSDAIESAGGISTGGSFRTVTVVREDDTLHVDMNRFRLLGDFDKNPFVRSGDRIHVPVGGMHATIRGPVNRPGYYEIVPGESVGDLLELAGGFRSDAVLDSVLIGRTDSRGLIRTFVVDSSRFGVVLEDRDEIGIYTLEGNKRRVYVFGAFESPGRYYLSPGEHLSELLARVGKIDDMADLGNAALERKNNDIIKLDLAEYLPPDPEKSLELKDGDVLGMSWKDNMVRVGGEVQQPGEFPHMNDWTVAKYVGMAGGPTKDGSMSRIDIYSPDGVKRAASADSRPNRGDVIVVKRSRSQILGSVVSGIVQLGTVVITIIVLSQ
jgi:protein involved in polysaccharide export with SLBB domain